MDNFPIVGIGCSAGGLEALRALFAGMPAETGLAFVVVAHLDPTRESHLSELLGGWTAIPVVQIPGPTTIQPNHVYVIAPDQDLTIQGGVLQPQKPTAPRGHRHPVDSFFRSLAQDAGERAIAIVLSGTGTNGTLGLRFIKAEGGIAIAQQPETAAFEGMPRSAISTGIVDLVLPPQQMPDALIGIARTTFVRRPDQAIAEATPDEQLADVLAIVRKKKNHDFTNYKKATLLRRINRRMGLHQIEQLSGYIDRLRQNSREVDALAADLTINVTGFFRDPEAWQELDEKVIAPLVNERANDSSIRVWVPGCSTGEEAYSIAMLVAARAETARKAISLRVFATDVAQGILASARSGLYPGSIANDIGADRLARFFEAEEDSYRIKKPLRDMITFAPQNLLQDPPFSRMDLISCRNLLIYLKPEAQRNILRLFHFALREHGSLFLGSAETVAGQEDIFETISKPARIYRRLGPTRHDLVEFPIVPTSDVPRSNDFAVAVKPAAPAERAGTLVEQALLTRYAPASVLVDRNYRVHYLRGPTGDYLQPPSGEPSYNLIAMAREGLEVALRRAVSAAVEGNQETTAEARVRRSGASHPVRLVVTPLRPERHGPDRLLISFFDREPSPDHPPEPDHAEHAADEGSLHAELQRTREDLRQTIEQMESSGEELRASNEEIRSINEELRASNEELETSKEELQSLNEELNTVNNQLKAKVTELETRTDDLNNLLNSTDVATLFLDRNLAIRWFTPAMRALVGLRAPDIGRPIADFAQRFRGGDLAEEARQVLASLRPAETEADSDAGRWYIRRTIPYRSGSDLIDGVVVTFSDITERKVREQEVQAARDFAECIVDTVRDPLLILTPELSVRSANEPFYRDFRVDKADTVGRSMFDLGNRQWDIAELRRLLLDVLPQNKQIRDFEVSHTFEQIGPRTMLLNARQLDSLQLILLAIEDISERKHAQELREMMTSELNHRVKNTLSVVQAVAELTLRDRIEGEHLDIFEQRLGALARAHDILVRNEWRGASLEALARGQLAPYLELPEQRVSLSGPSVILKPAVATPLVLVLHELATNAVKHGALKAAKGNVTLIWDIQVTHGGERVVMMTWTERGGPKVKTPEKRGTGSNLIECAIPGGDVKRDFKADGLVCTIAVPLNGGG